MARRRFTGGVPRSPGRMMEWSANNDATAPLFGSSERSAVGAFAYPVGLIALTRLTQTRLIGTFSYQINTAAAATDSMQGAVGIIKVSSNALGVGVTAIPSPLEDPTEDWIWWHGFHAMGSIGLTAAGNVVPIDVKSQRKYNSGEATVAVGHIGVEDGTVVLETSILARILDKLG